MAAVVSLPMGSREPPSGESDMRYTVKLVKTDEGYAVWCPGLPGCWSQGETEEEALRQIREAIREYLEASRDLAPEGEVRYVEVG